MTSSSLFIVRLPARVRPRRPCQGPPERGDGVGALALHGSGADPQLRGGLLDGEVPDVAQHDHAALAWRECPERGPDRIGVLHGKTRFERYVAGLRGPFTPPRPAPLAAVRVHDDRTHVAVDVVHSLDPVPRCVQPCQGVLDHVLRTMRIPTQQTRGTEQLWPPCHHVLAERCFVHDGPSRTPNATAWPNCWVEETTFLARRSWRLRRACLCHVSRGTKGHYSRPR